MFWLALGIGLFLAMNIGASGTAAAMSAAYGAGAVQRRRAMLLVGIFAFAGAILAGQGVTLTLGKGLLPPTPLPVAAAAVILGAAASTLFAANVIGIPLSTSEVTVGSVVGTAIVLGTPPYGKILVIVSTWLVVPGLSFLVAYLFQRSLAARLRPFARTHRRFVALLLTVGGCYEAFAAGANNVANAVGPLLGAGLVPMRAGVALGGGAIALGALTLGSRVLNTNAKKITTLDLFSGAIVSFTGATLVVIASVMGLPTPLTQVTTMGIVGVGYANGGFAALNPVTLRRVAAVWLVSPVISMAISYVGSALVVPGYSLSAGPTLVVVGAAVLAVLVGRFLVRPAVMPAVSAPKTPVPATARTEGMAVD